MVISSDQKFVVSGSFDNLVKVWDMNKGSLIRTLKGHNRYVSSLALTSDARYIVSGSFDRMIKVWNLATG